MEVGDLVRHMHNSDKANVGIVMEISRPEIGIPEGMASVLWSVQHYKQGWGPDGPLRNDWLYRVQHLEVVAN